MCLFALLYRLACRHLTWRPARGAEALLWAELDRLLPFTTIAPPEDP